jgi:hypothetical protein
MMKLYFVQLEIKPKLNIEEQQLTTFSLQRLFKEGFNLKSFQVEQG